MFIHNIRIGDCTHRWKPTHSK